MGLIAHLHQISRLQYEAAKIGNADAFRNATASGRTIDLDKAWHAVHFLATGDTSLMFLRSGEQVPDVSEHCEVHSPEATADILQALAAKSEMLNSFDPDVFNDLNIFPGSWDDASVEYIEQRLSELLVFLQEAADNKQGLLVTIS